MKTLLYLFIFTFLFVFNKINANTDLIKEAVENPNRKEINQKRDVYRNPYETLNFFGLDKSKKVLEIVPGRGWYTEIISTYMNGSNNFYVAVYKEPGYAIEIITKIQNEFFEYFKKYKKQFGEIKKVFIDSDFKIEGHENYFDLILTFRNTHNFLDQNKSENIYKSFHKSLKKNGILGVVQHRADESATFNFKKGYVKESFLIKHIEKQGFKLIKKTDINSNPKDLKNYSKGVWTLPPRYAEGDKNKSVYKAIGESDRMTLKFIKK